MKFEITQAQSDILTKCIRTHTAANQTLNEALRYHQEIMLDNQKTSDDMWREFEKEFELDMSLDWQFMLIQGKPYIVSQKTTQANSDASNN